MSQRVVRVNELLKREISHVLHTRYRQDAVHVTVVDVDTAPNLRKARVYYSTTDAPGADWEAERFFASHRAAIQREVGRAVILKYFPQLEFVRDDSVERGTRVNEILDDLGLVGEDAPPAPPEDGGDLRET